MSALLEEADVALGSVPARVQFNNLVIETCVETRSLRAIDGPLVAFSPMERHRF
jgi:hypothetical protein